MHTEQPICKRKGCTINKNLFYCHKQDSPRCLKCNDPCSICKGQRNKPLRQFLKKFITKKATQCRKCKTQKSNQWLKFSCDHSYCVKCVCKSLCVLIKKSIESNNINLNITAISCECSKSQKEKISSLLEEYCFCCGQKLEQKILVLNCMLKMNASCKRRIMFYQDSFNQGKTYLEKSVFQQLLPKCKQFNNKIEQVNERSKLSKQQTNLCLLCKRELQDLKQQVKQLDPNKVSKKQLIVNAKQKKEIQINKDNKQQPNTEKNSLKQQLDSRQMVTKKKCVTCSRNLTSDKIVLIQKLIICLECYDANKKETIKNISSKIGPKQQSNKEKLYKNHYYSHLENRKYQFKQCQKCNQIQEKNSMKFDKSKFVYLCRICSQKQQNKQNGNQRIIKQKFTKNQYFQYSKQKEQQIFVSNVKQNKTQECTLCFQTINYLNKSEKSEELGCIICNKCQLNNNSFYSQKQNFNSPNKIAYNFSQYEHKIKKICFNKQKAEQISNKDRPTKNRIFQEDRKIKFDPFQKNLKFSIEKQNIKHVSIKDRKYIPSVIQPDVQPYDLMSIVYQNTLISCFVCGYFLEEKYCFIQNHSKISRCVGCYINFNNIQ